MATLTARGKVGIAVGVALALLAVAVAALYGARALMAKPVPVYPYTQLVQTGFYEDGATLSGSVTADRMQKVVLSDTQEVTEILVHEGDSVKEGDALVTFDTTLSAIEVERVRIAAEKAKASQATAEKELSRLQKLATGESLAAELSQLEDELAAVLAEAQGQTSVLSMLPCGSFTQENPRYVAAPEEEAPLEAYFEEAGADDIYLVFVAEGEPVVYGGWHAVRDGSGAVSLAAFPASPLEVPGPEEDEQAAALERDIERVSELLAQSPSKAELAQLVAEQRQAIAQAKVDAKVADLDYRRKKAEVSDGTVRATCDGTITKVNEEPEAGEPLVMLSAGGGFRIEASVAESERESLEPGQPVMITSYMSGAFCEGVVEFVGTQPDGTAGGMGGFEQSTYPVVIRAAEDSGLVEGDYVEASLDQAGDAMPDYLPSMFVRYENGEAYVYARGADGRLERRPVKVGANLWGELVQIKEGLTEEDALAFPYGTDVREGAQVEEGSYEDLWNEAM